jgi:putative ABC transport system permease protein
MGRNLRHGLRLLGKNPGFTAVAVIALALGIGANTAIFSVVNAVLIRPLPFAQPDRLAMVWEKAPATGKTNVANPINFLEWRARNRSFAGLAALFAWDANLAGDGGEPESVGSMYVSDGFFRILSVQPIVGRWFTATEDTPGRSDEAILGEDLWRRRYGGDPAIVGRQIRVDNAVTTVVGVMPAGFRFPFTKAELWQPLAIDRTRAMESGRYLSTVARLLPGVSLASARADMELQAARLRRERPDFNAKWGATVVGLREQVVGDLRAPLRVLLGAVGLVLLIACANVANLLLMRGAGRDREIAVRAALGARPWDIAAQLLIENLLLAAAGGLCGLLLGAWALRALCLALPDTIAFASLKSIGIDGTVLLFTAAAALATGLLVGLAPALQAARRPLHDALRAAGGRAVGVGGRGFARSSLVVAEVALAMMLLGGAGLLLRSFARLASVDPGFDAAHVLGMQLAVSGRFHGDQPLLDFTSRALDTVRALPGVEAAGTSHFLPLGRIIPGTDFWRDDRARPAAGEEPVTEVLVVMPGYFSAMGIPLVRGRVFTDRDRAGAPLAVVVNRTLASQFFAHEDPVGRRLHIDWGKPEAGYEIVGVVGDVRQDALGQAPQPALFLANPQSPTGPIHLVVRTHGDPSRLVPEIRAAIHAIDRNVPVTDIATMDRAVGASIAAPRFNTLLLGAFAGLALILAAVGIFGVLSYSVAARTRELGIRRAVGASTANLLRLVLGQGMALAGLGLVLGLAASFAEARLLRGLLYEAAPTDQLTLLAVAALLAAVALAASYLPARRAVAVEPVAALRQD